MGRSSSTINGASNSPTLPVASQKTQHLSLAHGVFASELQHASAAERFVSLRQLSVGSEFETDAVWQFLPVKIRRVRSFEVGEVEFLAVAGLLGVVGLLGSGRREVQVPGVIQ